MNIAIPPILAQRLMINMRNINYMGSEPLASKLLFAPPVPGSEDSFDEDFGESLRMAERPAGIHRRGSTGARFGTHGVDVEPRSEA